jgi:hypothetical protein
LRKVAPQEDGVEEKRLRTVMYFNCRAPFTADDELTAFCQIGMKSWSSNATEEAHNFVWVTARLLDRVEEGWRRASEFPSQLSIVADEEG